MKTAHRRAPAISVFFATLLAFMSMGAASTYAGTLSLTGKGTVHFTPDAVHFALSTQSRGASASAARAAASDRILAWREAAGDLLGALQNYDDSLITVQEFSEYDEQGRPTDKRYFQATQTVRFDLTDLEQINRVIAAAEQADLSYHLSEESYYPTDAGALEDAALAAAIDDAKARCDFVAKRLDSRCGDVETLRVLDQGHYPHPRMMAMDSRKETVTEVREREINATVEVTFELD